jgi:hypothetical protein
LAKPRTIKSDPKVAINGTTFNRVMSVPLNKPQIAPAVIPQEAAKRGSSPADRIRRATTTELIAIIEPADKSMPPKIITSVIPIAETPTITDC